MKDRETIDDILRDLVASGGVGLKGVAAAFRKTTKERDAAQAELYNLARQCVWWAQSIDGEFVDAQRTVDFMNAIDAALAKKP